MKKILCWYQAMVDEIVAPIVFFICSISTTVFGLYAWKLSFEQLSSPLAVVIGLTITTSALCFNFGTKADSEDKKTTTVLRLAGETLLSASIILVASVIMRLFSDVTVSELWWKALTHRVYLAASTATLVTGLVKICIGVKFISDLLRYKQRVRLGMEIASPDG
jgi:hypothetical protein